MAELGWASVPDLHLGPGGRSPSSSGRGEIKRHRWENYTGSGESQAIKTKQETLTKRNLTGPDNINAVKDIAQLMKDAFISENGSEIVLYSWFWLEATNIKVYQLTGSEMTACFLGRISFACFNVNRMAIISVRSTNERLVVQLWLAPGVLFWWDVRLGALLLLQQMWNTN